MTRRKLSLGAFPVDGCDPFATCCLFLHVQANGEMHIEGMIRMPYSDRPKRGGGKAIPRSWLSLSTVGRVGQLVHAIRVQRRQRG
jgi:hypothetical protein